MFGGGAGHLQPRVSMHQCESKHSSSCMSPCSQTSYLEQADTHDAMWLAAAAAAADALLLLACAAACGPRVSTDIQFAGLEAV